MNDLWLQHLDLIAAAPDGVKRLRELILELAVRGKLVPQNPDDEPASELLKRIQAEKARLVTEGKIKKDKPLPAIGEEEKPFDLPVGWEWVRFVDIAQHNSGKTLDNGRNSGTPHEYITTSNLYWGRFELASIRQMLIRDDELEKCTASRGDLLICEGGEAGRAAVWEQDREICFQNHIHRARLFGKIDPYYAYRTFERLNLTGEISQYRKGVGISNMSSRSLASIPFMLPPIPEQHRIVAKVDELMALCDRLEARQNEGGKTHATLVKTLLDTLTTSSQGSGGACMARPDSGAPSAPERMDDDFTVRWERIARHFDTLFTTEASINALKQTIVDLAVRGALSIQKFDATYNPVCSDIALYEPKPYRIPKTWCWVRMDEIVSFTGGSQPPKSTFIYEPREGYQGNRTKNPDMKGLTGLGAA